MLYFFQCFEKNYFLFRLAHSPRGREDLYKGETPFKRLAQLVQVVAIKAVERADNAEVFGQRHLEIGTIDWHEQGFAITQGGQRFAQRGINGGTVELVYDQPVPLILLFDAALHLALDL